jgi:hypothetical protein
MDSESVANSLVGVSKGLVGMAYESGSVRPMGGAVAMATLSGASH